MWTDTLPLPNPATCYGEISAVGWMPISPSYPSLGRHSSRLVRSVSPNGTLSNGQVRGNDLLQPDKCFKPCETSSTLVQLSPLGHPTAARRGKFIEPQTES